MQHPFEIQSGELTIKGVFSRRSKFDIEIRITSPYSGLVTSRHLNIRERKEATYLDELGLKTAQKMLLELYRMGQYVSEKN